MNTELIGMRIFIALTLSMLMMGLQAQELPELYKGSDFKLGERLIIESKCSECHQRKAGGDGSGIYKPSGRINSPAVLRGMVEQCNTELNLGFFPDEVTSIAAVLNRDYYRFR